MDFDPYNCSSPTHHGGISGGTGNSSFKKKAITDIKTSANKYTSPRHRVASAGGVSSSSPASGIMPAVSSKATQQQHFSSTIQRGPLYKMVDAVIRGDRRVKWTHILHYLDTNTYADHAKGDQIKLNFESPLPAFCMPTPELAKELAPCPHTGDSLLRRCVLSSAPQRVVACLIHLCPVALTVPDAKGRVLLHLATRVPVSPLSEQILQLILIAHPLSLLQRDSHGRTPLHWLLWYHCADRTPEMVHDFCQPLPKTKFYSIAAVSSPTHKGAGGSAIHDAIVQDRQFALPALPRPQQGGAGNSNNKIPHVAAILPDAVFGCLPLHYAVANGASKGVLQVLLQAYPLSKHVTDRYGRTAAHWYLGAGQVCFGPLTKVLHISGEAPNPNAVPWYQTTPIDPVRLSVVLSSRVARTMDSMGRNPLHWACFTLAYGIFHANGNKDNNGTVDQQAMAHHRVTQDYMPLLQFLMDAHANQIVCRDGNSQTPLMVFLDTYKTLQAQHADELPPFHPILGGFLQENSEPTSRMGLELSPTLLKVLMHHPDKQQQQGQQDVSRLAGNKRLQALQESHQQQQQHSSEVASLEDSRGRLPLHLAASIGCGIETLLTLVQAHPTGLVHTTENYQAPLHMALSNPVATPYWDSSALELLLKTYETKSGVVVDGRIALKMEDASGVYPIHYATQHNASFRVLESLLKAYPAISHLVRQDTEDLAFFHLIPNHLGSEPCAILQDLLQPEEMDEPNKKAREQRIKDVLPIIRQKMQLFVPLLVRESDKGDLLQRPDSRHAMHVLHIAVLFQAASYPQLLQLLTLCPDTAKHVCQCLRPHPLPAEDKLQGQLPEWTVLDLHEAAQPFWFGENLDEWHAIRQLLFAHFPTVASHRHRHELLSQCVRVVIQEVNYRPKSTPDEYRPEDDTTVESSVHWHYMQEAAAVATASGEDTASLQITHSLSAVEAATRQQLGIRRPPLPNKPKRVLGGARPRQPRVPIKPQSKTREKTKAILEAVHEVSDKKKRKQRHKNSNTQGSKSKYDDEDIGYSVNSDDDDDYSEEDDESYTTYSHGEDDEGSYTSEGEDDEGSYSTDGSEVDGHTDGDERGPFSMGDSFSYSSGNPTRTFSSEGESQWSRSPQTFDPDGTNRRFFVDGKEMPRAPPDAFDRIRGSHSVEEKKEECSQDGETGFDKQKQLSSVEQNKKSNSSAPKKDQYARVFATRPAFFSEVGMRLWTFFALYCDVNNPNDNYVKYISTIFDEISFSNVERLVQLPLPSCAQDYLDMGVIFVGGDNVLQTFRDVSSPKCRELIHKTCFFVGTYEFSLAQDSPKNGATYEPPLVFCRPADQHWFTIRALEWTFTTQEATDAAVTPGLTEAEIWQTGEIPAETAVTFRLRKKSVVITFNQEAAEFQNEMKCRKALSVVQDKLSVLLSYYDAVKGARQVDKSYYEGIHDERFNLLSIGRGRVLSLNTYPYAFVYEDTDTLDQVYAKYGGLESTAEVKLVCSQLTTAVQTIHEKNIVHGNISMRSVVREQSKDAFGARWTLRDFSYGCIAGKDLLGKVSPGGNPLFNTATLPPEMFVQLTAVELQAYERYWLFVERTFGVKVERSSVDPVMDPDTGDTYVVRCHYMQPVDRPMVDLPPLPYDLITASPATDYWALGVLMFEMCNGRPLFSTEPRSGRLLEYHRHANWGTKAAASMIYSVVKDPIYQDLFLQLLSPISRRLELTSDKILSHPFFRDHDPQSSNMVRAMIETRKRDTVAHRRMLEKKLQESSETNWLSDRTIRLDCWDFKLLAKFCASPASIVRKIMSRKDDVLSFPNSIIVLPYQLSPNTKSGVLPSDPNVAVTFGLRLIELCKVCLFAAELGKAVDFLTSEGLRQKLTMSELFNYVNVPRDEFSAEMAMCSELASHHVETFRDDPRFFILKVVRGALENFMSLFNESPAYLYLVDEFNCIPLLGGCCPLINYEQREEVICCSILPTVLTCLCAWRTEGHILGFTKPLLRASHLEAPAEWIQASAGLKEAAFDDEMITAEIQILQDALSDVTKSRHNLGDDDLIYLRDFLSKVDPKRRVGDMRRVLVTSEVGLWTTKLQSQRLEAECQMFTLQDALEQYVRY